jgi:hypothetical protein
MIVPREIFDITVEVLNRSQDENAIATASAYLAYADQTDTIGYAPDYRDIIVNSHGGQHPVSVTFTIGLQVPNDSALKRFMDEMAQLSKVLSVEREIPTV